MCPKPWSYSHLITAKATTASANGASAATSEFTRKTGISLEEAIQILNIERDMTPEQVQQVRKHFDDLM